MNSGTYTFEKPEAAQEDCPNCEGYGHINFPEYQEQCFFCSGTGKVDKPEPAPTVSLYNLLDHSREDLDILHGIVKSFTRDKIEPIKENVPAHYTSAIAWIRILETAMKEREQRDSEASNST